MSKVMGGWRGWERGEGRDADITDFGTRGMSLYGQGEGKNQTFFFSNEWCGYGALCLTKEQKIKVLTSNGTF